MQNFLTQQQVCKFFDDTAAASEKFFKEGVMLKILWRSVTVAFWTWQIASLLILLYNFDMVVEVYQQSLRITQQLTLN
jgi:hypothetical protein